MDKIRRGCVICISVRPYSNRLNHRKKFYPIIFMIKLTSVCPSVFSTHWFNWIRAKTLVRSISRTATAAQGRWLHCQSDRKGVSCCEQKEVKSCFEIGIKVCHFHVDPFFPDNQPFWPYFLLAETRWLFEIPACFFSKKDNLNPQSRNEWSSKITKIFFQLN